MSCPPRRHAFVSITLVGVLAACLAACRHSGQASLIPATPNLPSQHYHHSTETVAKHSYDISAAFPEAEAYLSEEFAKGTLPGLAVGVVRGGGLAWFHGFAAARVGGKTPITKGTVFRIGSLTKLFTGLCLRPRIGRCNHAVE